jgi:hypothetical protein
VRESGRDSEVSNRASAHLLPALLVALLATLPAGISPRAAGAAPQPDPAPVKPLPQPAPATHPAPVTTTTRPATTQSSTATTTSSSAAKTKAHGNKKANAAAARRKARAKKARALAAKAKAASAVNPKPTRPVAIPVAPLSAETRGSRSAISGVFNVVPISLVGAGLFLLALAAVEPRFIRPRRLRKPFADHRGGVAMAGVLLLASMGIAYLISWSAVR